MEEIKLPFNVTKMSFENRKNLIEMINNGEIKPLMEVKDDEGSILGYDEVHYFEEIDPSVNETVKLPFNATKMSLDDKKEFIDKINSGDIEVMLEVRDTEKLSATKDDNSDLIGFQTVLSLDKMYDFLQKQLQYLKLQSEKLKNRKNLSKKEISSIASEVKLCKEEIDNIKDVKTFLITDIDDIDREFNNLGSYSLSDTVLSYKIRNVNYSKK